MPDLSALSNLAYLWCRDNQLTKLPDLSKLTNLTYLDYSNYQLIKLSELPKKIKLESSVIEEIYMNRLQYVIEKIRDESIIPYNYNTTYMYYGSIYDKIEESYLLTILDVKKELFLLIKKDTYQILNKICATKTLTHIINYCNAKENKINREKWLISDKLQSFMKDNHIEYKAEDLIEFMLNLSIY